MTSIDHLILNVNEIPASVDFYVNVLGFKLLSAPMLNAHGPSCWLYA